MDTMLTRRQQRITCDEEERIKSGYNTTTHFRFVDNRRKTAQVLDRTGQNIKLEDDELCSERLGQGRSILFWEAAEGSAGVLGQLIQDSYLAKPFLDKLSESTVVVSFNEEERRQSYEELLQNLDLNSPLERQVLDFLYNSGMRLPDQAQHFIPEANCKPDFVYPQPAIAIFCDGSVHDSPGQQQLDRILRDNLKYMTSFS
jgi:hypothetical protein